MERSWWNIQHSKCSNRIAKRAAFLAGRADLRHRKSRELSTLYPIHPRLDLDLFTKYALDRPQVAVSPRFAEKRRCANWSI